MNISNASCEYFYDEEYDIPENDVTYDAGFLNSFNNNCYSFDDVESNEINFECDLWSLRNSENNNLESKDLKCISVDNVIDMSQYSLSKNLPREHLYNYRLYFDTRCLLDVNDDIKKQFSKKFSYKTLNDSGKCSAATSDSFIHPFKYYRNELLNSDNNLRGISEENINCKIILNLRKNTSKELWRKLKNKFSFKRFLWKRTLSSSIPTKFSRSYSEPVLTKCDLSRKECLRKNRFSTTILELYNLILDLYKESGDPVLTEKQSQRMQTSIKNVQDVSCQCPELIKTPMKISKYANMQYPGLGKVKLPHKLRTSIGNLIESETVFTNLKFLERKIEDNIPNLKRSSSSNRIRGRSNEIKYLDMEKVKKSRVPLRCASESRCRIENDKERTIIPNEQNLFIIEENKSIRFSDLRPIPRKCGLSNCEQILAVFEFPNRTTNDAKIMEYDEESNIRIGGLVSETIASIKLLSDNVRNSNDLVTTCDKFIRCKDSNRQSTCTLLTAVDTVLSLISDGLSIDSVRGKKGHSVKINAVKVTLRLWMFIEESCRSSLIKDVSHRLAFASLLKQVKHICSNSVVDIRSKESLVQLKLRIFVVVAIKNNVLHVWLREVVINETILHRFFASCSFLKQARTSYSSALSAVVIEIRRLSTPQFLQLNIPEARSNGVTSRPLSYSSSNNSISKSKIPRPKK